MTGRSRHDELRAATESLIEAACVGDPWQISSAQEAWDDALDALLDEVAAAEERAADAEREREAERVRANVMEHERDFEQQVVVPSAWDKIEELTAEVAAERARADKATQALASVRAECDLPEHVATIVGEALA